MPATFLPASANAGFDMDASPHPWLMVPLNGLNYVLLQWSQGLSLRMRNPQIASFEMFPVPGRTRVSVRGLQPGETALDVIDPGSRTPVATLDVSVLPRKDISVSFRFLCDTAGHATVRMGEVEQTYQLPMRGSAMAVRTRPRGAGVMAQCVQECLKDLNDIYTPQTNLTFALRDFGQAGIGRDLGGAVRASVNLLQRLRFLRDIGARINVFFVWDVTDPGVHAVGRAMRPLREGMCVVDDESTQVGQTVAHEVGHLLMNGLRFHHFTSAAENHMLLSRFTSPQARMIPKQQALHMHQQA